jgi:signal transduction histidine kinase
MSRFSIRARLTIVFGVSFLLAGAALLALTMVLASRNLPSEPVRIALEAPDDDDATTGDIKPIPPADRLQTVDGEPLDEALQESAEEFRRSTLTQLWVQGLIALTAVGVVGFAVSWVLAGRALRPVNTIASTARRLNHENMDERIHLHGPDDELKELADTFDEMLDRIHAGVEAERRFVANASHELRTPLTVERTVLEVALSSGSPEALRAAGEEVLATNREAARLVDSLLVLATAEGGVPETAPIELSAAVAALLPPADDDVVDWRTDLERVGVDCDPALLDSLISNLIDNARRHNVDEDPWISVRTREHRGQAELVVANPGPIVSADDAAVLFEPFERGPSSRTRADGHGLGLAIVRAVAVAHRGTVSATPLAGGGLSVTVRLPLGAAP